MVELESRHNFLNCLNYRLNMSMNSKAIWIVFFTNTITASILFSSVYSSDNDNCSLHCMFLYIDNSFHYLIKIRNALICMRIMCNFKSIIHV